MTDEVHETGLEAQGEQRPVLRQSRHHRGLGSQRRLPRFAQMRRERPRTRLKRKVQWARGVARKLSPAP